MRADAAAAVVRVCHVATFLGASQERCARASPPLAQRGARHEHAAPYGRSRAVRLPARGRLKRRSRAGTCGAQEVGPVYAARW